MGKNAKNWNTGKRDQTKKKRKNKIKRKGKKRELKKRLMHNLVNAQTIHLI